MCFWPRKGRTWLLWCYPMVTIWSNKLKVEHCIALVQLYLIGINGLKLCPDYSWSPHSRTVASRWWHSSEVVRGRLHLLGGGSSSSTTEYLDPEEGTAWTSGMDLAGPLSLGCSVKVSPDEIITIGGIGDPGGVIKYNVSSGQVTRYPDQPPISVSMDEAWKKQLDNDFIN